MIHNSQKPRDLLLNPQKVDKKVFLLTRIKGLENHKLRLTSAFPKNSTFKARFSKLKTHIIFFKSPTRTFASNATSYKTARKTKICCSSPRSTCI